MTISYQEFITRCFQVHGETYDYSQTNYTKIADKVNIICKKHGKFYQSAYRHSCGSKCPKCAFEDSRNNQRRTIEDFISRANKIHFFKYDYTKSEYINSHTKLTIICPQHSDFKQTPHEHIKGRGCIKCGQERAKIKLKGKGGRLYTTEEFINLSKNVHGDEYDYSMVNYVHNNKKIQIICNIHGIFLQKPRKHLEGSKCQKCSSEGRRASKENFLKNAKITHNDKYIYDDNFCGNNKLVKIKCPIHGDFNQLGANHLKGFGCEKCGYLSASLKTTKSFEEFVSDARKLHFDRFEYVEYVNSSTKVKIICKKHGEFLQTPSNHLSGKGCVKCAGKVSKMETEWLDYLGIPERQFAIKISSKKRKIKVDGFDPKTNTIYEFFGDFWHGNPNVFLEHHFNEMCKKTMGELYRNTIQREKEIIQAGYNLVVIWEDEWIKIKTSSQK